MTLDKIAERVLDKEELDQMIASALSMNLDSADVCDETTTNCALMLAEKPVALTATDDSGIAPLLWQIAIAALKQERLKAGAA